MTASIRMLGFDLRAAFCRGISDGGRISMPSAERCGILPSFGRWHSTVAPLSKWSFNVVCSAQIRIDL